MFARAFVAFLLLVLSAASGHAIDTANFHVIGFSKSARWFAFSEFGNKDGTEIAFVTTYILDTKNNRWAPGTPIKVVIEGGNGNQFLAHDRARKLTDKKLRKLGIRYPGRFLLVNPMTEPSEMVDPVRMNLAPKRGLSSVTLSAKSFPAATKADCKDLGRPVGLIITGRFSGKAEKVLYRDKSKVLPPSRGCATGYSIAAVIAEPDEYSYLAVVLLYVSSPGWEGEDHYLTAVSVNLDG